MNTLLFIRHAETGMAGRFCGHSDPPVNERGYRQIAELLKALEDERIDAVYSSDLQRAVTTADAIASAFQISSIIVPALREIAFGEWEGLTWQEIEARDAAYARRWSESYPQLPASGGESFADFQFRVMSQVHQLLNIEGDRTCAVVTHAGVMRLVLRTLYDLDEDEAWERTRSYCSYFHYRQMNGNQIFRGAVCMGSG
jgi:alpha-ribazole phosphatase/probable phosphoglycerate mutase